MRERHSDDAVLVGFTTNAGTVAAASEWGGAVERKRVRPARSDSHEYLLHSTAEVRFFVPLRGDSAAAEALRACRDERAIGVIYAPESERTSHYFEARLADQFDAVFHFDHTRALTPLDFVGA